jgi:protein TonB
MATAQRAGATGPGEISHAPGNSPGTLDRKHSPLLVLSRDAQLVDTVRRAAPSHMPITHAANLDRIADDLLKLQPAVLLIDMAGTSDAPALLAQLTQHFPDLVVIVAGKREDSASLMQLTASGRIFRFLLTPISHGQARLAFEAAANQYVEQVAAGKRMADAGSSGGGSRNYVMTYGALGLGLLVAIGGIWTGVRKFTEQPEAPSTAAIATTQTNLPDKPDPLQAELSLAKEAFDKGRYLEPRGESALDLYRSALTIDPRSEAAKAGVRAVVDRILERAEAALTAERMEEAVRTIETARDIDPKHPRLTFLDTQVAREHERMKLSQARDVGNRVRTLVAQAATRMQDGQLIAPAGANARDTLFDARRLDPTDPTIAQGFRELNGKLAEAAQAALTVGRNDEARAYVNAARQLGAAGPALASVERALAEASRPAPAATVARQIAAPPPAATIEPAAAAAEIPAESSARNVQPAAPSPQPVAQAAANADAVLLAGNLKRLKEVPPKYPPDALNDRIEGWVDIDFIISPQGVPENLQVREAKPRRLFDRAAVNSVQQWRFEPIKQDGVPVAKRATLRVRFALK